MKDGFAREKLEVMDGVLKELEKLGGLKNLVVRYCKKCKHDTIQHKEGRYSLRWVIFGSSDSASRDYDYKCLNCGTKWECRKQEVCRDVTFQPAKKKTTKKAK